MSGTAALTSPHPTSRYYPVTHAQGESTRPEAVAEEVPVALEYNGVSHAVMFASPADLEDLALGFSLSEGIIAEPGELFSIEPHGTSEGITVSIEIGAERFGLLKARRRSLAGRTGCGICGTESLEEAIRPLPAVTHAFRLGFKTLQPAFEQLKQRQELMALTGAVHAAAWVRSDGHVALVREDVGRHNALDKLIGAAIKDRIDFAQGAVLITSRASFEMVHKCASVKIGMLAAVSAPTGLAIRIASQLGLTLIGFSRGPHGAVYTFPERVFDDTRASITAREALRKRF